ncbi:MAG: family 20 glycosylhydrolase, partial [Bacteroidetes bacterium]|nr:family 20 glycosylhydrolase [Bacteroidota bacterium]
ETSAGRLTIRANGTAGLFYGTQSLLQLIQKGRHGLYVKGMVITDWPDISWRAVHYDTKHFQEKKEYVQEFIRTLASYKINMLIWEWEDKFAYQSHPEIGAPGAFTLEEMQELTRYARKYHIQIVPLVQGLGHVSFILKHPENKHLREIPSNNWGFCPLNEGTYKLMFDLLKEAIEATPGSEYIHIGCDETYVLGKGVNCGCKAKMEEIGKYALRQIYINRVADQMKKWGRKPISWAGGYDPNEKVKPTEGLITWGGYDSIRDMEALEKGYPLYIYDPNPGIEHLFLPYFYKETIYNQYGSHLEKAYRWLTKCVLTGNFQGMISTSWNCSGVHNQIWMLRYITGAEYSWSGKGPDLAEFEDKYFINYYGPLSRDVKELFILLNKCCYYYMDAFEGKVWHWGEVGKTHLPDMPRDDIEYDPFWNTEYSEMVGRSKKQLPRMQRVLDICRVNLELGVKNSYDFELFTSIAELFRHTANTYLALSDLEKTVTQAHRAHFDNPGAAYSALRHAANIIEKNLAEREEVFTRIKTTWEKSQLPRGMSTTEKKYVHGRDQQRNFANRTPDLSFMIYDEQLLGLEKYLEQLQDYIEWYKKKYL